MDDDVRTGRRQFMLSAGRWLVGGAMLGATAYLATRPGRPCDVAGPCGGCAELGTCDLPAARKARLAREVSR